MARVAEVFLNGQHAGSQFREAAPFLFVSKSVLASNKTIRRVLLSGVAATPKIEDCVDVCAGHFKIRWQPK
jgi:hypothetical protein